MTASVMITGAGIGCGPAPPEATDDAPVSIQDPSESTAGNTPLLYVVRALVKDHLNGPRSNTLRIHHEAIDDLVGINGEIWGMDAMEMVFEVAEGVSLDDLTHGDTIELTLAVDWSAETPQQITAIEKLPADTELAFRPAKPPG